MAFGIQDNADEVMSEINMTPLVDVMLVLLIIFIITVPVMTHSIAINLPQASSQPHDTKPETIQLSVASDGRYFWNERQIEDAELLPLLMTESDKQVQPELHIRGDKSVRYERVAQAMASAQHAGIRKIGFITEPLK